MKFEVKPFNELEELLKLEFGQDYFPFFSFQLPTNSGFVFQLNNGNVVFIPYDFKSEGLVFGSISAFEEMVDSDNFPIEIQSDDFLETEKEKIIDLPNQIGYYINYLKEALKLDFEDINQEVLVMCLKKVVGRRIRKVITQGEVVGLIILIGEYLREMYGGQWFLLKRYGIYNPYYEPHLVTNENKVISITSVVLGKLKWRTTNINSILKSPLVIGLNGEGGPDFEKFCKDRSCIRFKKASS